MTEDCPDGYCRNNPTAYQRASDDMLHDHTEFCRTAPAPTEARHVEPPGWQGGGPDSDVPE